MEGDGEGMGWWKGGESGGVGGCCFGVVAEFEEIGAS